VLDADDTIYIGSYSNNLYAFDPDGTLKTSYATPGNLVSSPAIGVDGTLYFGCGDNTLCAFGD
jgi:outer membrane protein assembly factor BamB